MIMSFQRYICTVSDGDEDVIVVTGSGGINTFIGGVDTNATGVTHATTYDSAGNDGAPLDDELVVEAEYDPNLDISAGDLTELFDRFVRLVQDKDKSTTTLREEEMTRNGEEFVPDPRDEVVAMGKFSAIKSGIDGTYWIDTDYNGFYDLHFRYSVPLNSFGLDTDGNGSFETWFPIQDFFSGLL